MKDRLPLQVPCCENPGRAARRIAADDLRCCSAGCCRASSCASLVSARPSSARECLQSVRRCYFGVGVREHLWGSFDSFFSLSFSLFLSLFLVKSRYTIRQWITAAKAVILPNLKMNRQTSLHKPVTGAAFKRLEWLFIVIPHGRWQRVQYLRLGFRYWRLCLNIRVRKIVIFLTRTQTNVLWPFSASLKKMCTEASVFVCLPMCVLIFLSFLFFFFWTNPFMLWMLQHGSRQQFYLQSPHAAPRLSDCKFMGVTVCTKSGRTHNAGVELPDAWAWII